MSDISTNNYLNSLSIASQQQETTVAKKTGANNALGQSAFLSLMITQLENQNPLNPQDNAEFVAQLAQFSSVEGLERLNKSFDGFSAQFMSNQALQASSLVGTSVAVPASQAQLFEGGFVGGIITVPASTPDMTMNIYAKNGNLIEQIPMGSQTSGDLVFRWDGSRLEINGQLTDWQAETPMAAGDFRFEVLSTQDGKPQQLETALSANVNSVSVDVNNHLILNLSGIGPVSINDVKQFN